MHKSVYSLYARDTQAAHFLHATRIAPEHCQNIHNCALACTQVHTYYDHGKPLESFLNACQAATVDWERRLS